MVAWKSHPTVRLLSTAPAIGPIGSAQIVARVVVPQRFRTKRQFGPTRCSASGCDADDGAPSCTRTNRASSRQA